MRAPFGIIRRDHVMVNRHAARLRRLLDGSERSPRWPAGVSVRTLRDTADAKAMHGLLIRIYGEDDADVFPSFEDWWGRVSGDPEFSAELCFLASDTTGRLAGLAHCWTSAFLKDLAVRPDMRRRGIGAALLDHCFAVFRARGAARLDLKVELDNAAGLRLYERAGMVRVPWEG
jgi:ribosomal protein S18 acetylase RimI-like enzyme